MATYEVTKVRKESVSKNGSSHEHIVGVITARGTFYKNEQVVDSINAGDTWQTSVPDQPKANIKERRFCPENSCLHTPYLTTDADRSKKNNLENLPRG